jgi:seryl-tRNA synthetase
MIDLALLRKDPEHFRLAWRHRGADADVDGLVALDAQVRELKQQSETLKAEANAASKAIGQAAREGKDVAAAKEHARKLGDDAKALDERRIAVERDLTDRLLHLPNPCLPQVPVGKDSADNKVSETWGQPPAFPFKAKPHWELGPALDIIDFDRGAKLSGSGFVVLKGAGARLSRALVAWFLDEHTRKNGYTELAVPFMVQSRMMLGTGQLPKFADQFYACRDDDLVMIPTAEVPVTNYFADEILEAEDVPKLFTAYTPCFRREAGAAGIGTRGMTRVHQFDKVEMVWLTEPERAEADLLTLRGHAEALLRELGLHYRVLELCTGDTGFSSAHTFDLEVWSPGTNGWLEVSSCSNFGEFQARRAGLRYRKEKGGKPTLLATLNGSGLALPRCLIALIETYQQADGSVTIPEVLRPYMGGLQKIERAAKKAGAG